MSNNNQDYPTLGEETTQKVQQQSQGWGDVEIPTQKKNKKKLKLPTSNAVQDISFAPTQQTQNFDFSAPAMDFNFMGQQQQQPQFTMDFSQPQVDFNQMLGLPSANQEPYYTYPEAFEQLGPLVIKDQWGNYFELEENQYLENGQIFEKYEEPQYEQQEYNNYNYNQNNKNKYNQNNKNQGQKQQTSLKKDTKKETKKKEVKPPQPIKPRVFKRELKAQQQTEEQKQQELMGVVKKQERFPISKLQEKEKQLIQQLGDKYHRVNVEKEQINLVFIGHVDAGKSTLSGRVLVDTKEIDEKTLSQFETEAKAQNREGWFFAYAMDISEDERAKGKTVETGKAFFELKNRRFTLLDAPGHKNYVPNMIAGACQSDMACLIISSKPGEFESGFEKGGQTTEHVQLIKALGVSKLCCVVSKMDTNEWSEDRFKQIEGIMKPWLANTAGFNDVTFIPIDALGGQNISGTVDPGVCKWYNGPYLFDYLNKAEIPKRDPEGPVKIPVLDVQKEEGKVFIYGKIESGNIFEDIWVSTMPNRKTFQIQEIYDAKDRRIYYAAAGENIKFKVKGIEVDDVNRGYIVCSTDDLCGVAQELQAEIQILDMPSQKSIMSNGYKCILHMHTTVQEVQIDEVMAIYDKTHGKFVKSTFLKTGDKGIVKISSSKYLCLEKYSDVPFLGRFTIRDENSTIGYGTIRKYKPAFEFQRILLKNKEQEKKKNE